jgi:hypothetical protein
VTAPYLVVGAGASGLGCAAALAQRHPVELVERIPVAGGEAGWRTAEIQALRVAAESRGVRLRLGCAALRWQPGRLLIAGPGRIEWIAGSTLFFAGGLRPGTAAELGLSGDRPAGVLPATVALHLLDSGARLWSRVAIVGNGPWAGQLAAAVQATGGRAVSVCRSRGSRPWADACVDQARGFEVVGRDRVRALRVDTPTGVQELGCDAVLLAGSPQPVRNVTGALDQDDDAVTFVQSLDGRSVAERARLGREAATTWLRQNGETR